MNLIEQQVKLIHWLNTPFAYEPTLLVHLFANADDLLHQSYWRTYDIDGMLYQVAIVDMSWLKSLSHNFDVLIDKEYPNLYLARYALSDTGLIIPISRNETSIIHAIINLRRSAPNVTTSMLTDDKELQAEITSIFKNMMSRLQNISLPLLPLREIGLPLPSDDYHLYLPRLELLLEQGLVVSMPKWTPDKHGDIARRMRQLDMYRDDNHSIQGVYKGMKRHHTKWETLNVLEHAQYEGRVLGQGVLDFDGWVVGLTIILMDKFQENGAGTVILLSHNNKHYQVNFDELGRFKESEAFDDEVDLSDVTTYTYDEITKFCDRWWDGGRIGWFEHLFALIDTRFEDVNRELVQQGIRNWLELVHS